MEWRPLLQNERNVGIKIIDAKEFPEYATPGSACCDVRSNNNWVLQPGEVHKFDVGFAVEVPCNHELQVRSRSGLAKKGIFVINSPGCVDSDFRGELGVLLYNSTKEPFEVLEDHKIAQLVLVPVLRIVWEKKEELSSTERGSGGFGSTGK